MLLQNFRMALISINRNKVRSFLTVLGIVIGIGSVVTVIAVGEGLKAQVNKEVSGLGINQITISNQAEGQFSEADVESVKKIDTIEAAVPLMYTGGTPKFNAKEYTEGFVSATGADIAKLVTQPLAKGRFFNESETKVVVIGDDVAKALFENDNPVDKEIMLSLKTVDPATGEDKKLEKKLKVVGVFEKLSQNSSFGLGSQIDGALYIPLADGKELNNNKLAIGQISARAKDGIDLKTVNAQITEKLKANHKGKEDFIISTGEDVAKSFNDVLNQTTNFIAAIAAISLLVGGIGIMNIMMSSVTERTREIGIRKAIGAKRSTILSQFLIEALVLTSIGGVLGIFAAFGISAVVEATQDLKAVFTVSAFAVAIGISALVGVVFGIAPALKAARKKPIEALRYE